MPAPLTPSGKGRTSSRTALSPELQQNWEYARAQYEANIKTVAEIAREIGVTPPTVYAHIRDENWERDTSALQQRIAEVRIAKEEAKKVALVEEREKAERVNVEMQARVLVQHRSDIRQARSITQRLFAELHEMMDNLPELRSLGEIMRAEDDRGRDKLNDAYQKVLSLADRTDVVKKLSEALKTQLQLERQAFGIIGALEDPEAIVAPAAGKSEIDTILNKFDLVLKKKELPSSSESNTILGTIIDVS